MPKTEQIAGYFPRHFYAADPDKLLYHLINAFASSLEDAENHMVRILQAHWIRTLEERIDLEFVAALYSDLGHPYDDGVEQGMQRLKRIVELYLNGPGTVRSIFEFAGLELERYGLIYERKDNGAVVIRDEGEFIMFDESDKIPFNTRVRLQRDNYEHSEVILEENPKLDKEYHNPETIHRKKFFLRNNGYFSQYPCVTIKGLENRSANFSLLNVTTGREITYDSLVDSGMVLTITPDNDGSILSAMLEGSDVMDKIITNEGAQYDIVFYNKEENAIFSEVEPKRTVDIPLGESEWRVQMRQARFDEARYDEFVYFIGELLNDKYDATEYDNATYTVAPSLDLKMEWKERQRASFVLKLPKSAFPTEEIQDQILNRTQRILDRVKSAGVKSRVELYENALQHLS